MTFKRNLAFPILLLAGAGLSTQVAAAQANPHANTVTPASATSTAPSIATLRQRAETGNAEAQVELGQHLMKSGTAADKTAAIGWYREAAAQGNADGEWALGGAYAAGAGVPRDTATGLDWMHKSVSQPHASTKRVMAYGMLLMVTGKHTANQQQVNDGGHWLKRAADEGNTNAMTMLAVSMLSGHVLPANKPAAEQWMLKASRAGDTYAQWALGMLYLTGTFGPNRTEDGVTWLTKSADAGRAAAEGVLGLALTTGYEGVKKDPAAGVVWARKAAAQHDAAGFYTLGYAYHHGVGVPLDLAKAWYNFAAAHHVDTQHQFPQTADVMTELAAKLPPTEVAKLTSEVAEIAVPRTAPDALQVHLH